MGTTSEALKSIGVGDNAIYWDKSKIADIMKKHPEMTPDVIKQVPQILESPILVMQSQTRANRITVFGELTDANGTPILAAMELRPQNKRGEILNYAKVTSAYAKRAAQNLIDNSEILYVEPNKNRTDTWLEALRLHLPAGLTKYGSIGSVTYSERDVNGNITVGDTGGKTAMQAAFEKAGLSQQERRRGWQRKRGNLFYDLTKFRDITGREIGQTPSAAETSNNVSIQNVPRRSGDVKPQFSAADRRDVAERLREMLNSGASIEDIRRYVNSVTDTGTQRSSGGTRADGARQIVETAHGQNMSVDEYLRQNWEEYEIDGQLSADAQRALKLEQSGGRQYSIAQTDDGRPVAVVDNNILSDMDLSTWNNDKKAQAKKTAKEALLRFKNGIQVEGVRYKVNKTSRDEYTRSNDTERLYRADKETFADKMRAADNAGDIITATTSWAKDGKLKHPRNDNFVDFSHGKVLIQAGTNQYEAETVVGITDNGENVFYDVVDMEPADFNIKEEPPTAVLGKDAVDAIQGDSSNDTVPQRGGDVKPRFSVAQEGAQGGAEEQKGTDGDIRTRIPAKARGYLEKIEGKFSGAISFALNVPRYSQADFLTETVQDMSREYLETGKISDETIKTSFEEAYKKRSKVSQDFYREYKSLGEALQKRYLTPSTKEIESINDWWSIKRSSYGTLHIVNSKDGVTINDLYNEFAGKYPEIFPEGVTEPREQLVRLFEASRSVQTAEKFANDAKEGKYKQYKAWARNEYKAAISEALFELRNTKNYSDERAKKETEKADKKTLTTEEVKELYPKARDAWKNYEKVNTKNLLTAEDQRQVGRLLRGDIELSDLKPERDNVKGITAVYEAKQAYEVLARQIREWNKARQGQLRQEADELLKTANAWKDKPKGILYSRETMERNVRDIVKDQEIAQKIIDKYFKPVHEAAAQSTRLKNRMRDRVRALGLSRKVAEGNKVSESHAVQLLGEAGDNIAYLQQARTVKERDGKSLSDWRGVVQELYESNPNMDWNKVKAGVEEFRKIYDELFELMNDSRVRNGYEPVAYRKGYFPHFQPGNGDGIIAMFGKALGISTEVTALPTTINGLTHTFRPGIQYFGNALERTGFNTCYDAVEGFDKYIEGVADVIYQTENIQRLRALADQVRYRTTTDGLREQIDEVLREEGLSERDRKNRLKEIYEKGKYTLSNFVVELEEYTNLLANKKSRADRNMEQALGRNTYNLVKTLEGRVAANMVAVNPGSWLTNFIPLTQGGAMLDRGMLLHGMWDTLRAATGKHSDDIVSSSVFLTNRRGSDPLVRTWQQSASATMSKPMEWIDNFTADSLVRARYRQNVQNRQMSEAAAMEEADAWVAGVMADRSKGSTPTLFNRSNPLTKMFTQFQLEVNNQLSYVFKDMPRGLKEKGLGALAAALFKFALGAWLYNEVYEYFIGRRPALDPIGMLNDTVGDLTGWELPNMVSLGVGAVTGDMPSFKTEKGGVVKGLVNNVADQLPFMGAVGALGLDDMLGLDIDAGRLSLESAIPNLGNIGKAFSGDVDWATKKRVQTAAKEIGKPLTYILLPFGGGQMKKILEGVRAVVKGGSYTVDNKGRDIMQYPVYNDSVPETAWNVVKGTLFGKSSFSGAQRWVNSEFKNYSAKATGAYQGLTRAGVRGRDADNLVLALAGAEKDGDKSKKQVQIELLRSSKIPEDIKIIPYYALVASEKEIEVIDELAGNGAAGDLLEMLMERSEAESLKEGKSDAQRKAVFDSKLTDDEKITAIEILEPKTNYTAFKMKTAQNYGITMDDYYAAVYGAPDTDGDGKVTQKDIVAAIRKLNVSREKKAVLFQLADSGWTPKNNPFATGVGQEVYDLVQEEKARRENDESTDEEDEEKGKARWVDGKLVLPKW